MSTSPARMEILPHKTARWRPVREVRLGSSWARCKYLVRAKTRHCRTTHMSGLDPYAGQMTLLQTAEDFGRFKPLMVQSRLARVLTRSETDMAAMRRGWVHTMLHSLPCPERMACSRRYWGTCALRATILCSSPTRCNPALHHKGCIVCLHSIWHIVMCLNKQHEQGPICPKGNGIPDTTCSTWVVLPQPVSPQTTATSWASSAW